MTRKNFILATAGHVDHGKSAVVKALTGTDPDRLPEEKKRGITIELGFAHLDLPSPNESETFSIGVIDVPGHEDFVKKMVSGAGAIDLALLVVAADDGWMPQTEEHLQILIYLGVPKIVVALTKIDLAESADSAEAEVRAQLQETPFADARIVRVAATTGEGLAELRDKLALEFAALAPQRDIAKPRLHVDRAFSLRGIGTVVTGTLIGGELHRGETMVVQPKEMTTRIRSLQNHNRDVEQIGPGTRVALNLTDLPIASDAAERGLNRGDVVTSASLGRANATVDVLLMRSPRLHQSASPLRHGAKVRFHHGSTSLPARVFFPKREMLGVGEKSLAELRLTSPIFTFAGDRFVLRDSSEKQTLAGGIVLDPDAIPKKFREQLQQEFLEGCAVLPLEPARFVQAQIKRDRVVDSSQLLLKSCFGADEVARALKTLASQKEIVLRDRLAIHVPWWQDARTRALAAIDAEHKSHPQNPGLDLAQLRRVFALKKDEVFEALVADLARDGITRSGDVVKRATHQASLTPQLERASAAIRSALASKPFDPPSRKEMAQTAEARQALKFFLQKGEAIELSDEVVLGSEAFKKMRDAIVAFIRGRGPATVAELRQALESSRRIMVPLLERLDRDGVTKRVGDRRILAR
jgi:selenocysteine-specific elongation factor